MSRKSLLAHPIGQGELETWDALASQYGCLFDSIRWTRLFGPAIGRIGIFDAGGNLRGGFCVWEQRRFGLRILRNPPLTPHIGPFFEHRATNAAAKTNEDRDVMEAMAEFIDRAGAAVVSLSLAVEVKDCLPFYWRGYRVISHWTYRIDLNKSEEELLAGMSVDRRNDIRKAHRDGLVASGSTRTDVLQSLVALTFSRNHKDYPKENMATVLRALPPGANSWCFETRLVDAAQAAVYCVHDLKTAYYLLGGHTAHHGAGALAVWHSILKAKELGLKVFDFEGSVIPPIERYFRGFGGTLTPYFSINKAWLPIEIVFKFFKRQAF